MNAFCDIAILLRRVPQRSPQAYRIDTPAVRLGSFTSTRPPLADSLSINLPAGRQAFLIPPYIFALRLAFFVCAQDRPLAQGIRLANLWSEHCRCLDHERAPKARVEWRREGDLLRLVHLRRTRSA